MAKALKADGLAGLTGIAHGFFTRQGGTSDGIYASLNCGPGSKDDAANVRSNRAQVAVTLGTREDRLVTVHQVHSAVAVATDAAWPRDSTPRADAIVTKSPDLAIAVLTADCTPVLFADPEARVVGAAHAGWKGALGGVLEATIAEMEALGATRPAIRAAVGPCIGPRAYEVGPEFRDQFVATDASFARFFTQSPDDPRPYFDLPGFVAHRLREARLGAVESLDRCTYGNESLFYSYRRSCHRNEPDYGRQISAIVLSQI